MMFAIHKEDVIVISIRSQNDVSPGPLEVPDLGRLARFIHIDRGFAITFPGSIGKDQVIPVPLPNVLDDVFLGRTGALARARGVGWGIRGA